MMNKQSGLLALSAKSSDSRDIEEGMEAGDEKCTVAFNMFVYRIAGKILEMANATQGFDTMAFSAGIGENSPLTRKAVCERLAWMGVKIDDDLNAIRSDEVRQISTDDSAIRVLVVPTDEEYMIASDVEKLLG